MGEPRRPPSDLALEKRVLGSVLIDNEALDEIGDVLKPIDWYSEANRQIWEAMVAVAGRSQPIDYITLRDELLSRKRLAAVGGDEYLLGLTDGLPSSANVEAHATMVAKLAAARRMIGVALTAVSEGYQVAASDVDEYLEVTEQSVFAAAETPGERGRLEPIYEGVGATLKRVEEVGKLGLGGVTGRPSGLAELDKKTTGFHPGDFVVIAGRPSHGKTALGLKTGLLLSLSVPVAFFSAEMDRESIRKRALSQLSGVPFTRLRTGALSGEDWGKVNEAAEQLRVRRLFVDDTASPTVMHIRSGARRLRSRAGELGAIVVDYLQLARTGQRHASAEEEISSVSKSLKAIAKDLACPVIALAQLNRDAVKGRRGRRPTSAELRQSGQIEQDADVIVLVHRPELYRVTAENRGLVEVILDKQRNGATGVVRAKFFGETMRFENLEEESYGPKDFEDNPDAQLPLGGAS